MATKFLLVSKVSLYCEPVLPHFPRGRWGVAVCRAAASGGHNRKQMARNRTERQRPLTFNPQRPSCSWDPSSSPCKVLNESQAFVRGKKQNPRHTQKIIFYRNKLLVHLASVSWLRYLNPFTWAGGEIVMIWNFARHFFEPQCEEGHGITVIKHEHFLEELGTSVIQPAFSPTV